MNKDDYQYWAAKPVKEIADEILDKIDKYYEYLFTSGRMQLYNRSWLYYYRARTNMGGLQLGGEQGELTKLSVNHYRNLLLHLETMTTQAKVSFESRAVNTDVESQAQAILSNGLLDYYMSEKRMDNYIQTSVKEGLMYGDSFLRIDWDATAGEIFGVNPQTGATIYNGDVKYSNYTPINVIRDFTKNASNKDTWFILRDFENKYDLAAKYPDLAQDILEDCDSMSQWVKKTMVNQKFLRDSDNISVYTLLHEPTPAMPNGRYTQCLENGTIIIDGPLPFSKTHVYRLAPDEEAGSPFGYTVAFDLMPVQEMLDILYSTVSSNQSAFGVQNVLMPVGLDVQPQSVTSGLNIIPYDPKIGEPKPLQLTQTAPETLTFINMLEKVQETLSGANSVTRGNPEASLKSGSALALVQSMAVQFTINLQRSYAKLIEDVGTGTIKLLQDYASTPRIALIAGKANKYLMKSFKGDDLNLISRVTVDMGNPLTRTIAGRTNLVQMLMEQGLIENIDQFITVINTGKIEPAIEGKQAEMLLIRAENENLANGIPQSALITDKHAQHILEHKVVLSSPEARRNPEIVQATLAHIQEHLNLARTADPAILAILGEPQLPMAMPGMPPMQGGQPIPQPGAMQAPIEAPVDVQQQVNNIRQANMPSAPPGTDPATAEVINNMQGA